ncbi:MAG: DNA/RNA nuclease SfsA [Paracoccaceae bacterium]
MQFQTALIEARLIRRYQRFLADMELADGRVVVAHCANPGAMLGMREVGARCWLADVAGPGRKLGYSWKLVECAGGLAVVDTAVANAVVGEALRGGLVPGFEGYGLVRAEVPFGVGSRVDFVLSGPGEVHLEVKSVTLRRGGWAEFPDSVTARGVRHLQALMDLAQAGRRAVLLFLVARQGCVGVRVAADLDPAYARAFDAARAAGVEVLALGTTIGLQGVEVAGLMQVDAAVQARG